MPHEDDHRRSDDELTIERLADLEPLGRSASLLQIGLTLVDRDMTVVWANAHVADRFPELRCGTSHCFATYWGRMNRCADCLPLLVFETGERQQGVRFRARPHEPLQAYRVLALPVLDEGGQHRWVLESLASLPGLQRPQRSMRATAATVPQRDDAQAHLVRPMQQALRELFAQVDQSTALDDAASTSRTAFIVVDRQGRIVSWSPSASAIFGYELHEVLGRAIGLLVPEDRADEPGRIMAEVAREGRLQRLETLRVAKGGRQVPVAISAVAIYDERGDITGRSTVLEDRSEVHELRARLGAQQQLLAHVVAQAGGAVVAVDNDGVVSEWSEQAAQLLGHAPSEASGRPLRELVGDEPAQALRERVLASRTVRDLRMTWRLADGSALLVEVAAAQVDDPAGRPVGIAVVVRDASARVQLERQMVRSEKLAAVGSLAAGLAHEIGTPLNVISATAEYLLLDRGDEDPSGEQLRSIVSETERISRLVRELLSFAREGSTERTRVPLPDACEHVLRLVRHTADRKEVRLERAIPEGIAAAHAERDGLHQILLNLLLNAIEAVSPGGMVLLKARGEPAAAGEAATVVLEVHDDGPGVPTEASERVFDPFVTTRDDGTGLGLAVCARIVEAHGGDIRVTDSPLGGACFAVQLSAAPEGEP